MGWEIALFAACIKVDRFLLLRYVPSFPALFQLPAWHDLCNRKLTTITMLTEYKHRNPPLALNDKPSFDQPFPRRKLLTSIYVGLNKGIYIHLYPFSHEVLVRIDEKSREACVWAAAALRVAEEIDERHSKHVLLILVFPCILVVVVVLSTPSSVIMTSFLTMILLHFMRNDARSTVLLWLIYNTTLIERVASLYSFVWVKKICLVILSNRKVHSYFQTTNTYSVGKIIKK